MWKVLHKSELGGGFTRNKLDLGVKIVIVKQKHLYERWLLAYKNILKLVQKIKNLHHNVALSILRVLGEIYHIR